MFIFVDRPADIVLAMVQIILLGLGEMAVVRSHILLFGFLQICLAIFKVRGLARAQLAAGNTIGNALLLVFFASVDLIYARMARIDDAGTGTGSG